jgi:hypothetical protein
MTRVIPPRESMPSEAAALRRSQPGLLRWAVLRSAVLRLAGMLLLFRAALAWLEVFGVSSVDFLQQPQSGQIMIGTLAVIATMAGVGLWMLTLWGVALWVVCLGLDIAPLVLRVPLADLPDSFLANPVLGVSAGFFVLFILAAILSAFEAGRRRGR